MLIICKIYFTLSKVQIYEKKTYQQPIALNFGKMAIKSGGFEKRF